MMTRFRNSWALFRRSIDVLRRNPKLMLFPFVNLVAVMAIFLFFFSSFLLSPMAAAFQHRHELGARPMLQVFFTPESVARMEAAQAQAARTNDREAARQAEHELQLNSTTVGGVAIFYFMAMFLATFFNVAFYQQIIGALQGEPVSVREGLRFAMARLPAIFAWSFFAGAVGYLIRTIEQKSGLLGRLTIRLIGAAWSVAAVFAIPVIVCEPLINPIEVLKNSAQTFGKAWGETVVGFAGFEGVGLVVFLGSLLPVMAAAILCAQLHSPLALPFLVLGWLGLMMVFGYVSGVAATVFRCSLYLFASTGRVPDGFTPDMMQMGWRRKKS